MITTDYNNGELIEDNEYADLMEISDIKLSEIQTEDYPNIFLFPDSIEGFERNLGRRTICHIEDKKLFTDRIVGFIGRNSTHLSINSRFVQGSNRDYFLHYMLQKVSRIDLLRLMHPTEIDSVFDFLIYLFPLCLKRAIRQGMYKQYIPREYNNQKVKGVIDFHRQIRLNEPYNGRIAYKTREYSFDNDVTQLIRHTIEYLLGREDCIDILNVDQETRSAISQIIEATPSYSPHNRTAIISRNCGLVSHPFYTNYTTLQKLCLQILRHEEIKYGHEKDEIYGVLIDAAWLWEEYIALVIQDHFIHYKINTDTPIHLFASKRQQIVPDFISIDKRVIADAKYIRLDKEQIYSEERATDIYYKTIAYMYRFCTNVAYLLFPVANEEKKIIPYRILTEMTGVNGGVIYKLGLVIPTNCCYYSQFVGRMKDAEIHYLQSIVTL